MVFIFNCFFINIIKQHYSFKKRYYIYHIRMYFINKKKLEREYIIYLVKKVSELLHIDFALLLILSYWKKTYFNYITSVYCNFFFESSASKRNPQRRQDIAESALLETYHVRAAQ